MRAMNWFWYKPDNNYIVGDPVTEPKLELFKIQWRIPHVTLNEVNKLFMLRALESGRYLSMSFRSWDLYEILSSIVEHDEALVGYQDGYSTREATIRHLCS